MNARQMIARFADGGDVSTGLKYATDKGGIGADQYYANIRKFIDTKGADLSAAEVRAEMNKWGVSDKDVRDALAKTQYSAGAIHALLNPDIGAEGSPGYGVGGLEGMSANIRARVEEATRQAKQGTLSQGQAAEFFTKHLSPTGGFNEADLIRATGKTSAELLALMKPTILPTTDPLPALTEKFVEPTASQPKAPPAALTTGQEGLDTKNAIVGATPTENRVAKVTETAINKIPESERVKIPQLDTEFRASAPRTAIYDRFGRVTGYNYSPATKLTPATGTNVFNFVPPGITSRPRSLLNLGDVPGVMVDPVTGQMTMPLSASQRFARDRAELDNQFRQLYARAAAADTSLPTQAPSTAAAAFRNFAMNDPTMSAQLRMRNIEQTPTVNPTAAMTAARSEFGAAPYAAALTQAFDPFLARNRAALLASKDMQRSYFERYPDLVAEYEKNWSKTMSPEEYAAYHYRTLGQKEGRTPPNLMGSPYTQQFFSKGGEASTEDFIKKQSGGDVSRETASPNTAEVPQVDTEGRLIDEREEIRSESQRMLNRLQSQPSKLPPGIRRTVAATREQGKESMFPAAAPARDLLSGILGASPTAPGSQAYRTGQAIANMPPVQAAAAIPAKIAASAGDAATALAAMGPAVGAVMKPKGGNWLTAGDERGLKALAELMPSGPRNRDEALALGGVYARLADQPFGIKQMARDDAISNWIETKLSKYVKNEMATPEDPVRALAERGITLQGVNPAQPDKHLAFERELAGYPKEGIARTPEGKAWEAAADRAIVPEEAGALLDDTQYGSMVKNRKRMYPWLENLDPQTPVYRMSSRFSDRFESTGFRHLIDELTNAINPDSGLPRSLQLSPDKLQKVTVPQAVELVDKINKWRAEQKAATDLKRSQNAATVEYKAYETIPGTTEPNQRGLRWVELRAPTEGLALPKGYSIQTSGNTPYLRDEKGQVVQYLDDANGVDAAVKKVVGRMSLEDALKYEGETMGHCVGGYCPDVEEGRSRIYSLRDAKGEPHVTIEVQPTGYTFKDIRAVVGDDAANEMLERGLDLRAMAKEIGYKPQNQNIVQIKGKANRAPKDEYLPFVQDFVKSGNWSQVNDLQNTGLIKIDPASDLAAKFRSEGRPVPPYVNQDELTNLLKWHRGEGDLPEGFKNGGEVNVPRETSTSKQQLDKLAQVSQRKKA